MGTAARVGDCSWVSDGVGGLGARVRLRAALAVRLALVAACWPGAGHRGAGARGARGALDYQATVLNGGSSARPSPSPSDLAVTNGHVVRGLRPGRHGGAGDAGATGRAVDRLAARGQPAHGSRAPAHSRRPHADRRRRQDARGASGLGVLAAGDRRQRRRCPGRGCSSRRDPGAARADLPAFGPGLIARVPGVRAGFSGGPMLDRQRRLVGMVTAIRPGRAAPPRRLGLRARRARGAEEAYVLRARAIRAEVARLLAACAEPGAPCPMRRLAEPYRLRAGGGTRMGLADARSR